MVAWASWKSSLATRLDAGLTAGRVCSTWNDDTLIIGTLCRLLAAYMVTWIRRMVLLLERLLCLETNWPIRITSHLTRLLFQHIQLLLMLSHKLGRIFVFHVGIASRVVRDVVCGARDPIDPLRRWLLDIGLLLRANYRTQLSRTGMCLADKWWASCNLISCAFQTTTILGLLLIGEHGGEKWYVWLLLVVHRAQLLLTLIVISINLI